MIKPKLFLAVDRASHFLRWERSVYARHFDLVDSPGPRVALHGYAPDVLDATISLPAAHRSIYLMPGWVPTSPYYDEVFRRRVLDLLQGPLDLIFADRGPVHEAFRPHPNLVATQPSLPPMAAALYRQRREIATLLHLSADYPQKDWERSEAVMRETGLHHAVFPPRGSGAASAALKPATKVKRRMNAIARRLGRRGDVFQTPRARYVEHEAALSKMAAFDGFVHVAAPKPPRVDNMYTVTVLEAGATGAIVFWHDTHNCGGYLETVFELPLDPLDAAARILEVARTIDVAAHSKATSEEMMTVFSPERVVRARCEALVDRLT